MTETDDKKTRRSRAPDPDAQEMPQGWRMSRRSTRAGKKVRKDMKSQERRDKVAFSAGRAGRSFQRYAYVAGVAIAGVAASILVLVLIATVINGLARWSASRGTNSDSGIDARAEQDKNNLLLIALEGDKATGFLAIRSDSEKEMVYGIAIPDAAFIEVPGQGFERVGDSYEAGPDVSASAIANFLGVPFSKWVLIDAETYKTAVSSQSLSGVVSSAVETNMTAEERDRWAGVVDAIATENVAIVPLPTEPVNVGNQTYLDPQRDEVAALVEQWWGVSQEARQDVVRVIVYNGAGVPGIAGKAGQILIREGYRVVDTKNADRFDYGATQIIVQNGDENTGAGVRDVLGVGEVVVRPADQQVADVIVIIGKDYSPPGTGSE